MPDHALLSLEDVSFTHEGKTRPVFSGVSLRLLPGERLGLLGRNGSGKSTLLHIITGLLPAQSGAVAVKGRTCRSEADFIEARKSIGYLLQNAADQLFCATVLEDVAFGPYNLGSSEAEAEELARRTLEDLNLAHLADRNGQRLSGGEQKLAALATILVMKPDMLLLDEPTNDLDEDARLLLLATLSRFSLPCLAVSHDHAFLRDLCARFCQLENGRLEDVDAP